MSKIDIDEFFREQFHAHEKKSGTYTPEHWKNFEQLLDKQTGKRNNWGFSLNNLLFFMSAFVIVMMIPLFFLHSDTVVNSENNTTIDKTRIDKTSNHPGKEIFPTTNNSCTNDVQESQGNYNQLASSVVIRDASAKCDKEISANVITAENILVNNIDDDHDISVPVKKISLIAEPPSLTIINQPKGKKNKKQNGQNKNIKVGKIHRDKVLMPDLYYNGF